MTVVAESADLLTRLGKVDACAVSDALDSLGLPGAVTGLSPMWPVGRVTVGRVRTVQATAVSESGPSTHIASPLVATTEPGDVVVIANGGRIDVSCWGGLLAEASAQRGVAGVLVDGACRDVQECQALDLPLYARAAVPVSARRRIVQASMDEPVQFAGVEVSSHDWVVADWNGIAFIPADRAEEVLAAAERLVAREAQMADAVRGGRSIVDVMHDSQFTATTFTAEAPGGPASS